MTVRYETGRPDDGDPDLTMQEIADRLKVNRATLYRTLNRQGAQSTSL